MKRVIIFQLLIIVLSSILTSCSGSAYSNFIFFDEFGTVYVPDGWYYIQEKDDISEEDIIGTIYDIDGKKIAIVEIMDYEKNEDNEHNEVEVMELISSGVFSQGSMYNVYGYSSGGQRCLYMCDSFPAYRNSSRELCFFFTDNEITFDTLKKIAKSFQPIEW